MPARRLRQTAFAGAWPDEEASPAPFWSRTIEQRRSAESCIGERGACHPVYPSRLAAKTAWDACPVGIAFSSRERDFLRGPGAQAGAGRVDRVCGRQKGLGETSRRPSRAENGGA